MKKKALCVLLTTALCLGLAGCGKEAATSDAEGSAMEAVEETEETEEADTAADAADAAAEETAETEAVAETEEQSGEEAAAEDAVYESQNGWSVRYYPSVFNVNESDDKNQVDFVYSGEAGGTSMASFQFLAGQDPKTVRDDLIKDNADNYEVTDGELNFGPAFRADQKPAEGNDPYVKEDYYAVPLNDGTLLIDVLVHITRQDEIDIPISDSIAMLFDSLTLSESTPARDEGLVYMGGLYSHDGKSDMNLALFRKDGVPVVLVQEGDKFYYGDLETEEATLEDGSTYNKFSVEGKTFGYRFDEESTGVLMDENGDLHDSLELDESVAQDMWSESGN